MRQRRQLWPQPSRQAEAAPGKSTAQPNVGAAAMGREAPKLGGAHGDQALCISRNKVPTGTNTRHCHAGKERARQAPQHRQW